MLMLFVDAHCDTLTKIMDKSENIYKNSCHIDIQRLQRLGNTVQFFAAFIDPAFGQAYAMKRAIQIIDKLYEQFEIYKDNVMLCCNDNDIQTALMEDKVAAVLSIEGGDALQGDLSTLRIFYRLGVRSICLTWNHRNEIADGASDSSTGGGLTPFGSKVISEMNSLGMLIDLSHLSEKGFWDVMHQTSDPIIVSHSNAKSICDHRRNLSNEQIIALKTNGGVMGINLYPFFLTGTTKASLTDIIKHIEHISGLIGTEHIGIGADFDGIEITPVGIAGVEDIKKIYNELLKLNYSEESIKKLAGGNFMRVIKRVLK
jgi:membrane dipeptidase